MVKKNLLTIFLFLIIVFSCCFRLFAQIINEEVIYKHVGNEASNEKNFKSNPGLKTSILSFKNKDKYLNKINKIQALKYQNPTLFKQEKKQQLMIHLGSSTDSSSSTEKRVSFTIRFGQGGFTDSRSPIGKLGGGQLTLDIKPVNLPIAVSISNEYYTNSADPTHNYEISSLMSVNLLYMTKFFKFERANVFVGGGIGALEVPKSENEPDSKERAFLYNLEGGINFRMFWKVGIYATGKYLYSQKKRNREKVIDFSEFIGLLGITFNFSI